MDFVGGFHEVEEDDKLFLVYQHPMYQTIPQTQSSTSSGEVARDDKLLFLCPHARRRNLGLNSDIDTFPVNSSPEYVLSTITTQQDKFWLGLRFDDHPVHPLLSYTIFNAIGGCPFCHGSNFNTSYYFCETHQYTYHKECVESPPQIKHPYHPQHTLQLYFHYDGGHKIVCLCCGRRANYLVYQCTICEVFMHPTCAMKPIPFFINPPKRHSHTLTFFPRQTCLTCNVCGLLRKFYPTYICARCNFVAHSDCMHSPHIIKISRHHHRISYISSLPSGELFCGVCRQSIDSDYGAYACDKCGDYVVHSRCALRKDVWDRLELEGLPEEDDLTQDVGPFETIFDGVILHFLHDHHLQLEVNILYDENKLCEACVLPILEGNLYSCMECDFLLHETCAKARRRIQHALHPHPLILKVDSRYDSNAFSCNACDRVSGGFVYECRIGECTFDLDIRCASISEPFDYEGHEHPLFLALGPEENPIFQVCKSESHIPLNCIKCNFIVCFKCATLPYKARYKHDKHFLRILCGEEVCEKDWCEVCERNLGDTETKVCYWCDECCTTLHIECLFGKDIYMKPGYYKMLYKVIQILGKSNLSRPLCRTCENPCQGKLFTIENRIACSRRCAHYILFK